MEEKFQLVSEDLEYLASKNPIRSFKLGLSTQRSTFFATSREKLSFTLVKEMMKKLGKLSSDEKIMGEIDRQINLFTETEDLGNDSKYYSIFLNKMSEVLKGKISFDIDFFVEVEEKSNTIPSCEGSLKVYEIPANREDDYVTIAVKVHYSINSA